MPYSTPLKDSILLGHNFASLTISSDLSNLATGYARNFFMDHLKNWSLLPTPSDTNNCCLSRATREIYYPGNISSKYENEKRLDSEVKRALLVISAILLNL